MVQRSIADFLDRECERTSTAATRLTELSTRLSDAASQSAGVALTGCPSVALKRLGVRVGQGWSPQAEDRAPLSGEAAILRLSAISTGNFNPTAVKALADAAPEEIDRYRVRLGDLLMVRASGSLHLLGRACLVEGDPREALLFPDTAYRLQCTDVRLPARALLAILSTPQGRDAIEALRRGAANNKIRIDDVRNLRLPIPDQPAAFLALATAERLAARQATREAGALVARLSEYRDALIHEAVTGKIDVSQITERQMDERLHAAVEDRLDEVTV